jgi:hypothetical protein
MLSRNGTASGVEAKDHRREGAAAQAASYATPLRPLTNERVRDDRDKR